MSVSRSIDPPIQLAEAGLARWRELVGGVVPADRVLLAAYCAAWERWVQAEAWLHDSSNGAVATIRDDKGNVKSRGVDPHVAISRQAASDVESMGRKLGL